MTNVDSRKLKSRGEKLRRKKRGTDRRWQSAWQISRTKGYVEEGSEGGREERDRHVGRPEAAIFYYLNGVLRRGAGEGRE